MSSMLKMADFASGAQASTTGILDKIKSAARGTPTDEERGMLSQVDEAFTLTWKQRIIGFGVCVGLGLFFTLLSIPMLWLVRLTSFAILYSLGSLVSVGSTMFLMGPLAQAKRMFEQHRILATITYLLMIILTLVIALKTGNPGLCIIFIILQFCALFWYCLTWIPGGQAMLKGMIFRESG